MKLTVDHILDQGSGVINEDIAMVTKNTFGVFDGASSVNIYQDENGKTGGYLAAHLVKKIFTNSDEDLIETSKRANNFLQQSMEDNAIDTTNSLNRWVAGIAVARIDKNFLEWVQISDCLIMIIKKDGSYKLLVEDYDHDLDTLLLWKQYTETGNELYRKKFMENRKKVRLAMNSSYGALSGQKEIINFLEHGRESLEDVTDIILFTDGLFIPKKDLQSKDNFDTFVQLYNNGGLENVKSHVRELEASDPDKIHYPRFKVHDDIAAVSIKIKG